MSKLTKNLKLLMADPVVDANETFNLDLFLNNNWRKVDALLGSMPGVRKEELNVPRSSWEPDSLKEVPDCAYHADIQVEAVTEETVPLVIFHGDCLAGTGPLSPVARTLAGALRLYASNPPKIDLSATVLFIGASDGGGGGDPDPGGDIPAATRDTLGGVIVGDGLSVDAGGRLSIDRSAVLTPDSIASDEDVAQDINGILNG